MSVPTRKRPAVEDACPTPAIRQRVGMETAWTMRLRPRVPASAPIGAQCNSKEPSRARRKASPKKRQRGKSTTRGKSRKASTASERRPVDRSARLITRNAIKEAELATYRHVIIEAERLAKLEAERLAKYEAERLEAERLEAERLEAERLAKEEAERRAKDEADRLEAERLKSFISLRIEKEAHDGIASIAVVTVIPLVKDLIMFRELARETVIEYLGEQPMAYKTSLKLVVTLMQEGNIEDEDGIKTRERTFHSGVLEPGVSKFNSWTHVDKGTDIAAKYDNMWAVLEAAIDEYVEGGSGWTLLNCVMLNIHCHKVLPFSQRGSSFLPLPPSIQNKKACVNVNNSDSSCFKYAVLSALFCDDPLVRMSVSRASVYRTHMSALTFEKDGDSIKMPFDVRDAEKFERWNSQPITIFGLDVVDATHDARHYRQNLEIEYMSRLPSSKPTIMLIRIYNDVKSHYVWLKKPAAFLRLSSAVNPCVRCLQDFKRKSTLEKHVADNRCVNASKTKKVLPAYGEHLTCFNKKQPPIPFRMYMDGESMLKKVSVQRGPGCHVDNEHVYTHIGLQFVSDYPTLIHNEYKAFEGETCVVDALKWSDAKAGECRGVLARETPLQMTAADETAFHEALQCHICNRVLGDDRVRDHDHVNGQYRGAAHMACNLVYTFKKKKGKEDGEARVRFLLPVLAHNMKGYDSHFLMQFAGTSGLKIGDPIAQTLEKYMSVTIGRCKFVDSMQFLNSSLEKLVDSLTSGGRDTFRLFNESFKNLPEEVVGDLRRKGVFPYEWYDAEEKLRMQLPPREAFASKLCDEECPIDDYERAERVYKQTHCAYFEDYLRLYLQTDVVLLADVFESFRKTWYADHRLDPLNYITLPSLSWDSMLKKLRDSKATLEASAMSKDAGAVAAYNAFPASIECFKRGQLKMLEFVGGSTSEASMIRGGVSSIMQRYAEANNPYLGTPEQFNQYKADRSRGDVCTLSGEDALSKYGWDTTKPSSYIMYWDANNLYGWAMSQYLPIGAYSWLACINGKWRALSKGDGYGSEENLTARFLPERIRAIGHENAIGYILEVDGHWPDELHDGLNSYPLGPESVCFRPSPTTEALMATLGVKGDKQAKLSPNLAPKSKYKVHYRALQQMLEHGFVLSRVNRVLTFRQFPILKAYIDFNTAKRAAATSEFEKDLYKLANNSIYGKTAENVDNRIVVKFAQGGQRALYYAGQPRTQGFRIFSNELTAYQMRKTLTVYNRPMIVGAATLDISKTLMYDFHYSVMKKYGGRAALLFTDTDSLCYHIYASDVYKDMCQDSTAFDMSDYHASFRTLDGLSVLDKTNKKVIGKMKDEQAGVCRDVTCSRCRGSTPLPHAVRAFVGLRSKMYACDLVSSNDAELVKKTAKGVKKGFVERHIKFSNYKAALFGSGEDLRQRATFSAIRAVDHQVATIEMTKVSLCAIDTKRYVLSDNVHTLAHGHWRIREG